MPILAHADQKPIKSMLFKKIASSYFFTKSLQELPKSSFYTSNSGVNALIAAAQPLLSIITRIRQSPNLKVITDLKRSVLHELQVFEKHSLQKGINMDQVLIGRYCLSAMLDEVMLESNLSESWKETQLLPNQIDESQPKEQFFKLIDKLLLKPEQNMICLELMYLLLSLGYEGKYKHYPNKNRELNQVMDSLYEVIRLYRGCYQSKLLIRQQQKDTKKKRSRLFSRMTILIFFSLCLVFVGFSYVLDVSASFVLKEINDIVNWLA